MAQGSEVRFQTRGNSDRCPATFAPFRCPVCEFLPSAQCCIKLRFCDAFFRTGGKAELVPIFHSHNFERSDRSLPNQLFRSGCLWRDPAERLPTGLCGELFERHKLFYLTFAWRFMSHCHDAMSNRLAEDKRQSRPTGLVGYEHPLVSDHW